MSEYARSFCPSTALGDGPGSQARITESYEHQQDIRYAAARGWVDAIIEPVQTRRALALALEACAYTGDLPALRTGVLQV